MNIEKQNSSKWFVLCWVLSFATLCGLFSQPELWALVGVYHMSPYFADLAAILSAGEAYQAGYDVYRINPLDPFGRPHVYGPLWLVTAELGLGVADTWWLGCLLGIVFVTVATWMLAPTRFSSMLAVSMMLLSPPVLLAIERGNNDLIIFLLLVLAGLLISYSKLVPVFAAAMILVVAGVLKFYPMAALLGLYAARQRTARLGLLALTSVAFSGLLFLSEIDSYLAALSSAPRPNTIFAYGIGLLPMIWGGFDGNRLPVVMGFVAGGLLIFITIWKGRAILWSSIEDSGRRAFWAVGGGASWLLCYILNTNYQYRAVLLLLVVPTWLWIANCPAVTREARLLATRLSLLLIGTLWLSMPKLLWLEVHLSGREGWDVALIWLSAVVGAEQSLTLGLTVAVAVGLLGWVWRQVNTILRR